MSVRTENVDKFWRYALWLALFDITILKSFGKLFLESAS